MDLKAELGTAKEATKVSEQASYDLGVQETEVHLVEKQAEVCRDYCKEVWQRRSIWQESLLFSSGGRLRTFIPCGHS